MALIAVFLACFRDWRPFLGPGEVGTVMVVAADRRQARTIMRYAIGLLKAVKKAGNDSERRDANEKLVKKLLSISNSPDLVMDNGHYFGKDLTPQELEDLIDLLKTF